MTKINGIRTWSYVHKNKVIHKISDQYVKACRRKVRKTVTDGRTDGWTDGDPDGRTDGHHHTIIRPVWRRAYKNWRLDLWFWFNLTLALIHSWWIRTFYNFIWLTPSLDPLATGLRLVGCWVWTTLLGVVLRLVVAECGLWVRGGVVWPVDSNEV